MKKSDANTETRVLVKLDNGANQRLHKCNRAQLLAAIERLEGDDWRMASLTELKDGEGEGRTWSSLRTPFSAQTIESSGIISVVDNFTGEPTPQRHSELRRQVIFSSIVAFTWEQNGLCAVATRMSAAVARSTLPGRRISEPTRRIPGLGPAKMFRSPALRSPVGRRSKGDAPCTTSATMASDCTCLSCARF
jgi:hypothetical protein